MCEHSELVAEMPILEKMSIQERLKLARKRRIQQLKTWSQREKDFNLKKKKTENVDGVKSKKIDYKVHFVPSVMLLEAAARNDIKEVRRLLMLGVSPDSTNEDGLTALHQCCIDDSEEMMKLLIEFGANVNTKDSEQWTPLHAAATCGHLHLVKFLISKNANLLAVNADGNMPYDICEDEICLDFIESEMAKQGITQEMINVTRAEIENRMFNDLKFIAENGENLEFRDSQGATPLHIAAANGYSSVVEFLLDNHVSIDVVDNDFWQPIHAAACWGHPDVLELLVQAGADLNARTKNGETPLDICEDPELKEQIKQLRNEIETKKSTHSQRLKRSHSQNTRSQSVRRTSIREKSQLSRKEAREEARLRQEQTQKSEEKEEKQNDFNCETKISYVNIPTPSNNSSFNESSNSILLSDLERLNIFNQSNNQAKINDKKSAIIKNENYEVDGPQNSIASFFNESCLQKSNLNKNSNTAAESVKVEIHVTVNTNPTYSTETLADLKKRRSEVRTRILSNSESLKNTKDLKIYSIKNSSSHHVTANYHYESPPSPSNNLKKFKGDPSEIVGDIQNVGCCKMI